MRLLASESQTWVPAEEFLPGDSLKSLKGLRHITNRHLERTTERVYNIEVEGDHVYRVGESGLLVHNASTNPNLRVTTSSSDLRKFRAEDCTNPDECNITGARKKNTLTFTVRAGKNCSVRGHEFFQAMLDKLGHKVSIIKAEWIDVEGLTDNLDIFNKCIEEGKKTEEECAKSTYTGQWAINAGYTNVNIKFKDGAKPYYHEAIVEFSN